MRKICLVAIFHLVTILSLPLHADGIDNYQYGVLFSFSMQDARVTILSGLNQSGKEQFFITKQTSNDGAITISLTPFELHEVKRKLSGLYKIKLNLDNILPEWTMDSDMIEIKIVSGPCTLHYRNYLDRVRNKEIKNFCEYLIKISKN